MKTIILNIEEKKNNETRLIGKSANFIFNPNTRNGEELSDFLAGCEEVPDPTTQLQADKAELLEALENLMEYGSTGEDAVEMKREIESLIQKHKQ